MERRLVIDTTTAWLSLALFDGTQLIASDHRHIGRGHAELLLPAIAALPNGGRADAIWVGCGPGSFTGLRIGIAAARALGFAWGAPVAGFDSLALIAAQAQRQVSADDLTIATAGGHGQWLIATAPFASESLSPETASAQVTTEFVAGDCAQLLVDARGYGTALPIDVDARAAYLLRADAFMAEPTPIYARAPDAKVAKQATPTPA